MIPYKAYLICINERKRKPELEPIILTDPYCSYCYALNVVKERWPEAEPVILTDPYFSYYYARDVIKGRWLKAEPVIKQNKFYWKNYCLHFNIKKNKINWKVGL